MSLSDLNDILLVVNQKIQEEETLSPDDTADRLNRLNKLKDDISAEVEAMSNASSDEEEKVKSTFALTSSAPGCLWPVECFQMLWRKKGWLK